MAPMHAPSAPRAKRRAPDRRAVALGVIVGVPCLAIGLRAAVAEAAASGKPVLTQQSFNALVRRRSHADGGRAVAGEMGRDFRGFVRANFTLTPIQERRLDAIPQTAMSQLQSAFAQAAASGGTMTISFQEPSGRQHPTASGPPVHLKGVTMHVAAVGRPSTVTWSTD